MRVPNWSINDWVPSENEGTSWGGRTHQYLVHMKVEFVFFMIVKTMISSLVTAKAIRCKCKVWSVYVTFNDHDWFIWFNLTSNKFARRKNPPLLYIYVNLSCLYLYLCQPSRIICLLTALNPLLSQYDYTIFTHPSHKCNIHGNASSSLLSAEKKKIGLRLCKELKGKLVINEREAWKYESIPIGHTIATDQSTLD